MAHEDTLMIRGIISYATFEYQGCPNRACWLLTSWIENSCEEHNRVCEIGRTQRAAYLATYLEEQYSYHCYMRVLTAKQRRMLDRPIFARGMLQELLDRNMTPFKIAETLERAAEYGSDIISLDGYLLDLLTWGLAILDYTAYVTGEIERVPPTYQMVLNTVLSIIDWRYVADHYLD